jgi:hypothetical protein
MRPATNRHVFWKNLFSGFTNRRELEFNRERQMLFEIIRNFGPRGIDLEFLLVKVDRIPEERVKEPISHLQYEGMIHDQNGRLKLGTRIGSLQN